MEKPKPKGYPHNPQTIGEHIRKKRMDKGLLQGDLAILFDTSLDTITNWENNRCEPQISYVPKVIAFLEYNPFAQEATTLGEKIKAHRLQHGLSHKKFAKLIEVDSSTI